MSWSRLRPKRSKFGAVKTADGFPSKLEGAVYQLLLLRERAGELKNIKRQAAVRLREKCPTCGDPPVVFKVDFSAELTASGETIYVEAKGAEVASYRKRKKIWKEQGPGLLEVWKGTWRNPKLAEEIYPKHPSTDPREEPESWE